MSFWLEFLPIIIYILLIIILIVGIILGFRIIVVLGKAQRLVDNLNQKIHSLDGVFQIVDTATDKIVYVTDIIIENIMAFISKIFAKDEDEKKISSKGKKGKKNE